MLGNTSGVHGSTVEELVPVVGVGLEAELFCPSAKDCLVARRRQDFALDFAPVAGVVAVLQTEFTQAEALSRS